MCATATQTARNALNRVNLSTAPLSKSSHDLQNPGLSRHWSPRGGVRAELASDGAFPRTVRLNVSFGHLHHRRPLWAARFWEADPPPGAKPVEWLLDSTDAVTCLEQALELLDGTQGLVTTYAVI